MTTFNKNQEEINEILRNLLFGGEAGKTDITEAMKDAETMALVETLAEVGDIANAVLEGRV